MADTPGDTSTTVGGVALFLCACGVTASVAAGSLWPLVLFAVIALAVAKVSNEVDKAG